MATRKELTEAVAQRYREASKGDKSTILDEFEALTGITASTPFACYVAPHMNPARGRAETGCMTRRCGKPWSFYGKHPTGYAESD